jgi:hypothetical protein
MTICAILKLASPGPSRLDVILATAPPRCSFRRCEMASHLGAQKVSDERAGNRKPNECTQVAAKRHVRYISDHVCHKKRQAQSTSPLGANPQTDGGRAQALATANMRGGAQKPIVRKAT